MVRCEILVVVSGKIRWISKEDGVIPSNAIRGGRDRNGDSLYIGRMKSNNGVTVGEIRRSKTHLTGVLDNNVVLQSRYDILVDKTPM